MSKQYTEAEVHAAVHNAIQEVVTGNACSTSETALDSSVRTRMASLVSGGYDWADTLHNIYSDYGYPATLSFFNFWNMYRRFGLAKRVVDLYPDQTWLDDPIITSKDASFNKDLLSLIGADEDGQVTKGSVGLWRRMKGLDKRQRVGQYGGMFMRVKDNKKPEEPLDGVLPGINALVDMTPLYESQLKVLSTEEDPTSENFGQPTMYQYSTNVTGSRNPNAAGATFKIHPSRVVIAAEGSDNGGIYGVSALESVYNSLMDCRKVSGGGGEGFYKNASQSIIFSLKDGASASTANLSDFNDYWDDFMQNRSRRAGWTPGMDAKTIESNLISPKDFMDVPLMDIAAGAAYPTSVLIGNQTGVLAGGQDTEVFLGLVQARRLDFATDMVVSIIDWMMEWGVLPTTSYSVEWPDAQAPSKEQKLENAAKMADINQKQYLSAGQVPFTAEEIREESGYDPEELEEAEELPDETIDDDETEVGTDEN